VGLVPELLPAIVGVTLAHGARRMARTHVIVKRLAAIENFGSMDVLCSDKTGTLTEGHVTMEGALDLDGAASDEVLRWAAANASFETGMANPIDAAVCAACKLDLSDLHKLDEVPYDFVRKRLSVLVGRRGEAGTVLVTKGALDQVLEVCSGARRAGSTVPLADVRAAIDARFAELSERGLRTLGLAVRELPGPARVGKADERDMTFLGFLAFFDPPKPDIERTIADLRGLGVRLKIVTGDNRRVAAAVARRVGFADPAVLSGPELHTMSDAALVRRAAQIDVFAEVEPNQKERIILALKKAGAVVGYIGDGINDAPALHVADVGISVEGAVDVAKEAAEIVLLKSDLRVLVDGVREGRTTFANTLKYVFITTSANFGNMLSMAGAALFLPFLPLLPKQILLNNFLSDFPAMTIATDRVDPEQVERPRRWDTRAIRTFMLVFGAVSSLFDVLCFGALWWLGADAEHFRSGWFVLSLLTEVLILLVVRTRRPLIRSRPSRAMAIVTAAVAVGSVALLYLPGAHWLGFAALPARYLAAIGALTLGYVAVSEAAKGWFFRHFGSA
jgi:Mg2+-importing ATPase